MLNLRIIGLLCVCFANAFAENVANISDSLAVETTVDTIKLSKSLAPEVKSKPEKRDSSDQIGPTIFSLKADEPFRPIPGASYPQPQQLQLQPQQFQSSPAPSTFQPTTVRYEAEEAAPQGYYNRPPNVDGPVDGGIHYGSPRAFGAPFKGPYQLQLEQTHPQQQPYQQRHHQQHYVPAAKPPPSSNYASPTPDVGFTPLQQPSAHHHQPYYAQAQEEQQQVDQQKQKQLQQQQQKHVQLQPPFMYLQRQQLPQQQQLQYQQPGRQQFQYIIAIPLSYVRQLQHQLAAHHGSPPATQQPQPQQQQRGPLPPLIVLQPVGGGSSGASSFSREPYRQQPLVHYVPQAPAPSNPEAGAHVRSPHQQLPVPLNLILAAAAVRPRQPVYPAPQLLYVQPQLIRHAPQQQLQPQVKQQQQLPHYAQTPDQQQPHAVEERSAQQPLQQTQPQQHEHRPKSTVKLAVVPSPSAATASTTSTLPLSVPSQATFAHAPTALPLHSPLVFYNPTYVQVPPPEQHPLPPSHYGSYIPGQFVPAQQAATLVKLSSPSALLAPHTAPSPPPPPPFFHIHHPFNGLSPLAAMLNPQSLLVAKPSLQHPQPPNQQQPALPAFVSRPAVYMAPQEVVDGIGVSGAGAAGGLPYFVHPAGVHYGTHLYNPAVPLVATSNLLENVASADGDNQQRHHSQQSQLEHHRRQQQQHLQQQLRSRASNAVKDDNNAIVKYP